MKRFLMICVCVILMMVFITPALADYKAAAKQEVIKQLQDFFQVENGNRLTVYSMRSLLQEIDKVFNQNLIMPAPPPMKPKNPNPEK